MSQDIPNFLLRKPSRPVGLYSNWRTYKDKAIVFYSDTKIERWDTHPDGIIIEIDKTLFLNGETRVFHERERERERVRFHVAWPP